MKMKTKTADMARGNSAFLALIALICLGTLFMLANPLNLGAYDPASTRGGVTHIVMFQFKDNAATDAIADTNRQMLALKDTCKDPATGKPYIRSLTGGKDNSIEGQTNGVSHAFVVQFKSAKDRDYYVNSDPSHGAFKQSAGSVLEKAIVVDFSDGAF